MLSRPASPQGPRMVNPGGRWKKKEDGPPGATQAPVLAPGPDGLLLLHPPPRHPGQGGPSWLSRAAGGRRGQALLLGSPTSPWMRVELDRKVSADSRERGTRWGHRLMPHSLPPCLPFSFPPSSFLLSCHLSIHSHIGPCSVPN